jgi:tRNA nucleotidyltransferase (CCA-adding enzyme)
VDVTVGGTAGDGGLRPPAGVLEIAAALEDAGFETWCVGGAVRDAMLGHANTDWDLATAATPAEMRRLFRRIVPLGEEHGTMGVLDRAGVMHEVTTFRRDVETDGRHARVVFDTSIDGDLARRDFTINAIAISPSTREVRDPFDGRGDLARRLIRAVGDPADRMREDRLRALRAIRFAARFDFDIEAATWTAIVDSAPSLTRLSAERVHDELRKTMLQAARPALAMRRWLESGAFGALVPSLAERPMEHLTATSCVAPPSSAGRPERRDARLLTRLAVLFAGLPYRDAERALRALKFSNTEVRWLAGLSELWRTQAAALEALAQSPEAVAIRRLAAAAERPRVAPLLRLASAIWAARREAGDAAPSAERVRALYRRSVRSAYRDPIALGDLAVDGDDVRRSGIPAGPLLGTILHRLLAAVVEDPRLNTVDALLALARRIAAERSGARADPAP